MEYSFSFSFSGRVELLKYVYFYAQKSIIKAGYNKFQDLINAPRTCIWPKQVMLVRPSNKCLQKWIICVMVRSANISLSLAV